MKKARGSALVIAMLLIAAVAGMAFGIARLIIIESATAARYENGSAAYFAAESGIEEGFLRYKFNQNAEVPFTYTLANSNVSRTRFPNDSLPGTFAPDRDPTSILLYSNAQYYDLRMGYIGGNYTGYTVNQDDSIKINLTGYDLATYPLNLSLQYTNSANFTASSACKAIAEAKFTVKYSTNVVKEYKAMMVPQETCVTSDLQSGSYNISDVGIYSATPPSAGLNTKTYTENFTDIHQIITTISKGSDQNIVSATLSIKPLTYNMQISSFVGTGCGAACNTDTNVPAGPYTTIDTTGYFGGVSRKISANIDRQSGTVYDLYDFVIFKGN